jgi:hypothetical protein
VNKISQEKKGRKKRHKTGHNRINKCHLSNEQQNALETMNKIIARESILAHPNFEIPSKIHTDASAYQLGVFVSQNGKPIAFFSRKLAPAQTRYTTTEREPSKNLEQSSQVNNSLFTAPIMKT